MCFGGSFLVTTDVLSHVIRLERNENFLFE